jgi:hypothetical protein
MLVYALRYDGVSERMRPLENAGRRRNKLGNVPCCLERKHTVF